MKIGLVLEGGAMRGIYTAGVLDAFLKNNIEFDGLVGVSAGAIHGATFLSKQYGRNLRYMKKYCSDWRYMSFRSLIINGDMVGRKFCYYDIPSKLDPFDYNAFFKNKTKFYTCATNLKTGKAEFLYPKNKHELLEMLRASASMPLVSRNVPLNGNIYLDGGVSDSIPLKAFQKMGYKKNIVVLTRPLEYVKMPEKAMPFIKLKYYRYPLFVKQNRDRHLNYNKTIEYIKAQESLGNTLVIRPSKEIRVRHAEKDTEVIQAQYDLGFRDAMNLMNKIKEFMK